MKKQNRILGAITFIYGKFYFAGISKPEFTEAIS